MRSLRGAWCVLLALQTARSDAFCPPPGVVPGVQPLGHGRRAPDFLVVGTVKGGTSALGCAAEAHPSIGMLRIEAPIYESHFFNGNASFYSNWDRGQAWYERSLDGLKAHDMTAASLVGEKSPDYLCDPEAPMRIFSLYPRVTIIALLREPVARAYSHWNMIKQQHVSGRYILHLQRYEKLFPRSALNVFIYEDGPPAALGQSPPAPHAQAVTRCRLQRDYAPYNERLYTWLGLQPRCAHSGRRVSDTIATSPT
ncbi:hypothetical protein EMIHUDRAFT_115537 [Emiliania huxleyi CCMP1516]|uniref:Sulfotransferase domain-containing protein n=2 Tax=Emiliania huxleyi TaxID=2903 RepID=A0A0D3JPJ1_EMIH1|nr:hypothetical protein EMIHUDRAFT_115537 [Emiliania huxleyi CCMP1516]EOD25426.1 hypothetical protein EMIHUDRAFT_115537 [Emiliania huxleyi CCMP1516]|eukprot:XP_005777855.1 hypothetical protein EMIHUDRAFT_115537 [Emiliania huxleyi CCMP1516]